MSIHDLKHRMSDVPGIEALTMVMLLGRQHYNIGGKVVQLPAAASAIEVEVAICAAMSSDAIAQIPAGTPVMTAPHAAEGAETMVPSQAGEASPVAALHSDGAQRRGARFVAGADPHQKAEGLA